MATLLLHKNRFLRIASLLGVIALLVGVSSSVTPRAAGSAPTAIQFKAVASCGGGTFDLKANGTTVASFPAPTTCVCAETVQTRTITASSALAAVSAPGCTDWSLTSNQGIYVSWAKVTVVRQDGNETSCITNGSGGCASENPNFCAGYTHGTSWGPGPRPDNDADGQNNCTDADMDNDGVANAVDNCSLIANTNQANADGNGFGDACDPVDVDGDGVWNMTDNCPTVSNAAQTDTDGDGVGDLCEPNIVAVPWMGSEALFHEVTSGGSMFLQAVATDGNGIPLTNIASATWDSGDGVNVAASMPLGNGAAIERTVTYTGSIGQPFTATVRVTTTNGRVYTDTMNIRIAADTRETRVNMAIDKALWYLHKRIVRVTADGKPAGYWENTCCSTINNQIGGTAPVVQAFEINNHRESGDRRKDPYVDDVKFGLRFILSATTSNGTQNILRSRAKVMQGSNNPDGNNNNRVLNSSESDHAIYLGGQVMDALVASGTPNKVADVGEATWVNGQTYSTIVQDLIDGYSQGMNDDKGGWLYTPNDGLVGGNQSFDISSSHWWAAGVLAAQGWNLDAPVWVKTLAKTNGFPNAHTAVAGGETHAPAAGECHWHYRGDNSDSSWDDYKNVTPAGLILMNAAGMPKTDAVFKCTEKWIANRFAATKGNPYAMYQTTKGMRTAFDAAGAPAPITLLNGTIDWYAEYADYIVAAQNTTTGFIEYNDGGTAAAHVKGDMQTAWNVIILSPSLFELPPSASCSASPATIGKFGGNVNFSAAASFHPDATATITGYAWNFGDATAAGSGVTTSHNYAVPASFPTTRNATVTVTDSNGNSATASCPVTIVNNNVPPSVTIAGPYTVCKGSPITLVATASDEDGTIGATEWDLNSPINFATIDATGLSYDATAFFGAKTPGAYNIGFRAADNDSASSSAFSTVTVLAANDPSCNQPPVITVPANMVLEATSPAGAVATFAATATDDHDTITPVCTPVSGSTFGINPTTSKVTTVNCTATDLNGLSDSDSFTVTVQDTTPPVMSLPPNATIHATSSAGATFTYGATATDIVDVIVPVNCDRPSGFFPMGLTTVNCTAFDKHNNRSTASFTVSVTNAAPVAVNDAVTTHGPITINVLANDSDPDGDSLNVSIMSGTSNGSVLVQPDKTIRYFPNGFQSNNDSFTYQITDNRGGFSTATVSITVTNAVPVAVDDSITLAHNVTTFNIPVRGNDTDSDGDTFTVFQVFNSPNCHCQPFVINPDGTVKYTSIPNSPNTFSSPAQFTYTIRDQYGAVSAPATVTVNFANAPPVANPVLVTTHGTPVTVNVVAATSDPDGDARMLVGGNCTALNSLPPSVGFCNYNPGAGTVTFTPNGQWFGPSIQIGYTVNDGHSATASSFVRVSYVNQLPVPSHPSFSTSVNTDLPLNQAMVLAGSTDPDGDQLTIDGTPTVLHGSIIETAPGAGFYRPNPGFIGIDTMTYTVDDDHGGIVTSTATITVSAPTTTTVSSAPVVYGNNSTVTVTVGSGASGSPVGILTLNVAGAAPQTQALVNGSATFTFAGLTAGDHDATASYAGQDFFLSSVGAGVVSVSAAPTTTVVTCTPSVVFNGSAQEVCTAKVTSPDGFSDTLSVSYTDNVNVGTATASASYAGDANHTSSSDSETFQITKAPTTTVVTCTATTVYNGNAQELCTAKVTGDAGLSLPLTVSYTGNTNAGTATGSASYAGDDNYSSSSDSETFQITKAPTETAVTCPASRVYTGSAITPCTANVTGAAGLNEAVAVTYDANTNAGTASASATYAESANYASSTDGATFEITKAAAVCSVTPYSVTYDTAAHTATGSCTGVRGESLAGLDLSQTTQTNAGTYTAAWAFTDVTGNYSNTGGSVTDTIAKAPTKTTLAVSSPTALAGAPVTLTATVISVLPGAGIPNGTVTFYEGATSLGTSNVNAAGVATLTTTTLSNGPHTITATYNESSNFLSSASNTVATLIYGLASGGGTFVISDTNATLGKTVNFWGSQWQKNNIPTGGHSNASFKGFAITPAVPTVGATFTSAPGNSVPQPSAVPQYIGIIVTSKVTKSGSNITGTIVKLVVVKVNAGYVADPGHAGTGTIVAFIQ